MADEYEDGRGGMGQSRSVAQLAKYSEFQSASKERTVKPTVSLPQKQQPLALKVPQKIEADTSYDDDFEDYNEDFEEEEESPPKPKPVQKPPPPKPAPTQATMQAQAKGTTPSSSSSTSASPVVGLQGGEILDSDIAQIRRSMEIENNEALAKRQAQAKSEALDAKGFVIRILVLRI